MEKTKKAEYVHQVFENISSGYDKANDRISLGLQKSWKMMLVKTLQEYMPFRGKMLDLCCGTGDIAIWTAKKRPDACLTGADFSSSMLKVAEKKSRGLKNVNWVQADALSLPWPDETFDAVTISFGLRNTADYQKVVSEMFRIVKKGGTVYCLDSFIPEQKFVLPFYRLYFRRIMPLLGGGKKYNTEYQWLWKSTEQFLRQSELKELYRTVGFEDIDSRSRLFGCCTLVSGRRVGI